MVVSFALLLTFFVAGAQQGSGRLAFLGDRAGLMVLLFGLASLLVGLLVKGRLSSRALVPLALALLCTLLPFALALVALRRLSAYAVQLVTNLEPVYAIVFAILLLDEQKELTALFYLGVAVILGAVFLHPLLTRSRPVRHPELLATSEAKNALE